MPSGKWASEKRTLDHDGALAHWLLISAGGVTRTQTLMYKARWKISFTTWRNPRHTRVLTVKSLDQWRGVHQKGDHTTQQRGHFPKKIWGSTAPWNWCEAAAGRQTKDLPQTDRLKPPGPQSEFCISVQTVPRESGGCQQTKQCLVACTHQTTAVQNRTRIWITFI